MADFPRGFVALRRAVHLALCAALSSCGSGDLKLCGRIPEGGCPLGRGGTCDDKLCAALYDCTDGAWTLVEACAGGGGTGGQDAGTDAACDPVVLDHTGETVGCTPDLQSPDCPVAAAETCAQSACLTECLDFFLCTADGWTAVAYCDEQGKLVTLP